MKSLRAEGLAASPLLARQPPARSLGVGGGGPRHQWHAARRGSQRHPLPPVRHADRGAHDLGRAPRDRRPPRGTGPQLRPPQPARLIPAHWAAQGTAIPLTWNILQDVRQLFEFHFMVNAYRAGTVVAVAAGLLGWFMVLRAQSFAGHTLAVF